VYKVVETDTNETWDFRGKPLVGLEDEYGGRAKIVIDDHCLVLFVDTGDGFKPATHWFREAVDAIPAEW